MKTGKEQSPLNKDAQAKKPSMNLASAPSKGSVEGQPVPSDTATQGKMQGDDTPSALRVDPQKVAEKVYELMKQEVILGRMRRGG
ncbi:MAG: hypothetical protein H7Y17_09200 [Chlorobia bacterium]|nr:hypothetical protein [Fimbriimonadaceae bacterium]